MSLMFYQYTIGGIHSQSSKEVLQPQPGRTEKWSPCYLPPHSPQQLAQSFGGKRMDRDSSAMPCPEAIISYKFMGGVDRGDRLRGYYSCRTKSRKFYKYIFNFLLDVAITNAFVLYMYYATCSKFKNIRDFRVQLAKELIGDYFSRRRVGRHVSFLKNLPLRHFPVKLESADTTRRNRHCCTRCVDKYGKRTDTQWFCQECAVRLCHTGKPSTDCFLQWHKNIDLHQYYCIVTLLDDKR